MQYLNLKRHGFTLIELIIVVVLVGVVAMFAIPNYTRSVSKTHERAAINALTIIYSAQNLYYNSGRNEYYPKSAEVKPLIDVNTALGLTIIPQGATIQCSGEVAGQIFVCSATHNSAPYVLRIQNTSGGQPCCQAGGTCSIAPPC